MKMLIQSCLLLIIFGIVSIAGAENGRSVTVRFPAFSISPGERISGMKFKTSQGRVYVGCRPNRWACDHTEGAVHCYALHPNYAVAISGMLPEMIITHLTEEGGQPSIEASVEFVDGSGKEYSKDMRQNDMIIK